MDALSGYEERNTAGQGLEVWQENPEAGFLSIQRPSLLESGPTSCQTCKQPKAEKQLSLHFYIKCSNHKGGGP